MRQGNRTSLETVPMTDNNLALRVLSLVYFVVALLEASFYWSGSPFYVLGFDDPLIRLWAFTMFVLAAIFFSVCIYLFVGKRKQMPQKVLTVTALVFTLLGFVPALFYYNVGFSQGRILWHLAPIVFLFPLARTAFKKSESN